VERGKDGSCATRGGGQRENRKRRGKDPIKGIPLPKFPRGRRRKTRINHKKCPKLREKPYRSSQQQKTVIWFCDKTREKGNECNGLRGHGGVSYDRNPWSRRMRTREKPKPGGKGSPTQAMQVENQKRMTEKAARLDGIGRQPHRKVHGQSPWKMKTGREPGLQFDHRRRKSVSCCQVDSEKV